MALEEPSRIKLNKEELDNVGLSGKVQWFTSLT